MTDRRTADDVWTVVLVTSVLLGLAGTGLALVTKWLSGFNSPAQWSSTQTRLVLCAWAPLLVAAAGWAWYRLGRVDDP